MKILVIGGASFIGKHLVRSLLEKSYLVTIFDNFSNSTKDSISSLGEQKKYLLFESKNYDFQI